MQTCYNIVHLSVTGLLQSIITKAIPEASRLKGLIDMCRTRWAARYTAYTHFYQAYPYVIAALENISCGANHEMCVATSTKMPPGTERARTTRLHCWQV